MLSASKIRACTRYRGVILSHARISAKNAFLALNNLRLLENHYKKLNKGDVMGEFLNNYVLKSREDNGRCDVLAIFADLIYVDVDADKPFGPKLIKNEETRPNNNLIPLYFFISFFSFFFYRTFLKILC